MKNFTKLSFINGIVKKVDIIKKRENNKYLRV